MCVIGGDWNRLATNTTWIQMLEDRGLHLCKNPLSFTRIKPDGVPGATLDRVAASCHAVVTHLQISGLTDHLIMHVRLGHSVGARPFPKHVLQDPEFLDRIKGMAELYAYRSSAAANDPARQCELWEAFKKSIVIAAHKYAKQLRRRASGARKALQQQFNDLNTQPQDRVTTVSQMRQLEECEVEQELHRRSVHRLSTWERPCHDFYSHGQERAESFSLPSLSREEMLARAKDFYAELFREDQPAAAASCGDAGAPPWSAAGAPTASSAGEGGLAGGWDTGPSPAATCVVGSLGESGAS